MIEAALTQSLSNAILLSPVILLGDIMTNTKDITLEERIEAARKEVAMLCETKAGSADCAVGS
jgi:hypothetical protein